MAVQITDCTTAQRFDTLTFHTHPSACLGFFWNSKLNLAVQRRYFQLTTQSSRGKTNRQFAMQIQTIALENLMGPDTNRYIQIACRRTMPSRLAFPAQTDTLSVIYACRNIDFYSLAGFIPSFPVTFNTRVFNMLTCTMTSRTSLLHTENRLLDVHRTRAFTSRTGFRGCPGFRAAAVADIARFISRNIDAFLHAFCCFFKRDFDTDLNILTLIIRLGTP